tara:strand:- start:2400 stop:5054 length:2655 start_codon:yes stop_codon:yes gene_type:complete
MRKFPILLIFNIVLFGVLFSDPYEPLDIEFLKNKNNSSGHNTKVPVPKSSKKPAFPLYNDVIKDCKKIEGLFDFYWNEDKHKIYISIKENQFNQTYLASLTRQSGDAYYYDAASQMGEFPFQFKKIANVIQWVHVNVLFRAEKDKAISKAIDNNFSDSIFSTSQQVSMPHEETGAILVDANKLFIKDIGSVGQRRRGQYKPDASNSFFKNIKSFVDNTEIDIVVNYRSAKGSNSFPLPNSKSMAINYHISLSSLPNHDYIPRVLDDRVGYFETMYQDYTNTLQETQYVRFINRWNLIKKDKYAELSDPIEPIVFWIDNKVPKEFRPAIREGALAWNEAFERIGFKNAIVVKQMPDDATWDPADVRYNTIRWFIQPGSAYAVGPSRANPFTGEIYDADVRISADFVTAFYDEFDEFVQPVTAEEQAQLWSKESNEELNHSHAYCDYASHLKEQMSFGWHNLISQGIIKGTHQDLMNFIHEALVDLTLHEVGHTLGLRHNFKASSIYSIEQLSDKKFTQKYGVSGSVMDYHPVSLFDNGETMFQTHPGPYDHWAIEYGYSEFDIENKSTQNELILLENIANQSNHPLLAYATDEDTFGRSARGVDPLSSLWDMSSDPIGYYDYQIDLANKLFDNILEDFEKNGNRYQKLRTVFSEGIWQYAGAGRGASKFIGGLYFKRNHIGDPGGSTPFEVVPASEQRRALNFITSHILNKDVFNFDPDLLNKLAPERYDDFRWRVWRMDRLDYPIHRVVNRIYIYTLYSLFDPLRLARVQDNEMKFNDGDPFTMEELFNTINNTIWEELSIQENINSYKRQLQNLHIDMYSTLLLGNYGFNNDSLALTRSSLKNILKSIYVELGNSTFNASTKSHLEFIAEKIETILDAEIQLN